MADLAKIKVPDLGDVADVDVIEVLVNVGDTIAEDDSLIVLETDKATMEVPSSGAGVVKNILVSNGDKVSEGDVILEVESTESEEQSDDSQTETETAKTESKTESKTEQSEPEHEQRKDSASAATSEPVEQQVEVPDIGEEGEVEVIEVLVNAGDSVDKDASLIVLESDKAAMEVPSPYSGKIESLQVKVGDKVSQGTPILKMLADTDLESSSKPEPSAEAPAEKKPEPAPERESENKSESKNAPVPDYPLEKPSGERLVHASPAVRRFARELGADLSKIKGTGRKNRVVKKDVESFVKYELSRPKATAASGSFAMPEMPKIDFSQFGEIEEKPLTRIQKVSSVNLHRNWITIPHVTQHEDADITELEAFRKQMKEEALKEGVRLTPLAFIMKALVASLKAFPTFNASLASDGENLILKKYFHIGVAVDTPEGLVVPVIRDVDKKSVYELANELGEVSEKARDKKLGIDAMRGSSITISSLGGIGGTAFTPIVNSPDVAILGLSRNQMKPVWNGKEFEPRLMLPMSLSYDHRVIDGAVAARFIVHFAKVLGDIRRVLL